MDKSISKPGQKKIAVVSENETKLDKSCRLIDDVIKAHGDSCILMCSLGKDSLVALDLCYGRFRRIICVFMYFVDNMEHIEKWVRWVKARYPEVEFVKIPHWNLSYIFRSGLYCVRRPDVKLIKLTDVVRSLRIKYGIETCVLGMKAADGMNRRLMLGTYKHSGYYHKGMFYPLAEWNQREVLSYMKMRRLPEPVRYCKNASNGAGFNEEFFVWLEKNHPQDLELVYKSFPLSRRILFEYHRKEEEKFLENCKITK